MNRLFAFYVLLSLQVSSEVLATRFLGTVAYPQGINQIVQIKVLYKGDEYSVEADSVPGLGQFQLIEQSDCKEFHILVSESLKLPNNTGFDCFETSCNYPYKLFKLTRSTVIKPGDKGVSEKFNTWDIEELQNQESREIPVNTIVFLLPASFVQGLEAQPWRKDDHVAWLPKIMLDTSLTESRLREGVVKMLCTLMDFKPFHAKFQQHVAHVASNCIVSMPLPRPATIS